MTISATTQGLRPGVCTSTSRPSVPFDGMLIYETDTNRVAVYDTNAWVYKTPDTTAGSVLQVVSTTKTDTFTASLSAAGGADITGLTATITPRFATSQILCLVQTNGAISTNAAFAGFQLIRGSTVIGIGNADGNRSRFTAAGRANANSTYDSLTTTMVFMDSPSTTSATTYGVRVFGSGTAARTVYVNRADYDTNDADAMRLISTITVMEIAQ